MKKEDFASLPFRQKRAIVEAEIQHVFSYPRWREVLEALDLEPTTSDFTAFVKKAAGGFCGGESEAHKALKAYVAQNPLASSALWPMGDTKEDASYLQDTLGGGDTLSNEDPVRAAMSAMFARDSKPLPEVGPDGSLPYG